MEEVTAEDTEEGRPGKRSAGGCAVTDIRRKEAGYDVAPDPPFIANLPRTLHVLESSCLFLRVRPGSKRK